MPNQHPLCSSLKDLVLGSPNGFGLSDFWFTTKTWWLPVLSCRNVYEPFKISIKTRCFYSSSVTLVYNPPLCFSVTYNHMFFWCVVGKGPGVTQYAQEKTVQNCWKKVTELRSKAWTLEMKFPPAALCQPRLMLKIKQRYTSYCNINQGVDCNPFC